MRILFLGDVVGNPGRTVLKNILGHLKVKYNVEFTVANGENLAGGNGLTEETALEIKEYGVDVITGGNHTWDKKQVVKLFHKYNWILRPLNYPPGVPGRGFSTFLTDTGKEIGVINLLGRVFIGNLDCPFRGVSSMLKELHCKVKLVDFHAEVTSEKQAMGYFLDGKVSAVIGTHTHVQTADDKILPGGTAYITDVGMVGGFDGVIGIKKELALERLLLQIPIRFEPSKEKLGLEAVFIEIDEQTGRTLKIERIREFLT